MKAIVSASIRIDCSVRGVMKPESYRAAFRDQLNRLRSVGPILAAHAELEFVPAANPASHAHVVLDVPGGCVEADADDRSVGLALSQVMRRLENELRFHECPAVCQ